MIPVIFIHNGNQEYFQKVITQAKKNNYVVVLNNDLISKYSYKADKFSVLYEHLSTNNKNIELMCFSRWFILLEFMEINDIHQCFHLDSDVMLYVSAEQEFKKFEQFDFTLSHRCCGSNSFFTLKGLSEFCDFVMRIYTNKTSYDFEKIASHYYIRQKHGLAGGVCDMTLLEYYAYTKCGLIGEMMHIIEGSTYDHNINVPDQDFEMSELGIKNFRMINNQPYVLQKRTNKLIKFNTLHFQGDAKRFI